MKKSYVLDTNVLLEDPKCIEILRNGEDNDIFIPFHVILELDKLKKEPRVQHLVAAAVETLQKNQDAFSIVRDPESKAQINLVDLEILREAKASGVDDPVLVTNDRIFQILANSMGVASQEFKSSNPFQSESQRYTGFIEDGEETLANAFQWIDGKPVYYSYDGPKIIDYEHEIWKVKPRSVYQNLAFELLLDPHVDLVSLQSEAGFGKTYLALAAALFLTLQQKSYDKVIIVKPMIEIGEKMGYLPGEVDDKMAPYVKYLFALLTKLHKTRRADRIFKDSSDGSLKLDTDKFEILPLAFIRGMNIENAVVIVDETQNLSRNEARALLTRMGENTRCFCLGDTHQVDNPYLNQSNNALNWIVRMLKGQRNYGHLVLKGAKSRGPICDTILRTGL